jgi:hypothetical protein
LLPRVIWRERWREEEREREREREREAFLHMSREIENTEYIEELVGLHGSRSSILG